MPLISAFYGILVYLYWLDTKHHNLPHVHARYAEFEAVFAIQSGDVLDGEPPRRQQPLVQACIELHRDELLADWSLAVRGEEVFKIEPLK
jgi:hypothetical protein